MRFFLDSSKTVSEYFFVFLGLDFNPTLTSLLKDLKD